MIALVSINMVREERNSSEIETVRARWLVANRSGAASWNG